MGIPAENQHARGEMTMIRYIYALAVLFALNSPAMAKVLVLTADGQYLSKPTLAEAVTSPDTVGRTILIVDETPITGKVIVPSDRAIRVESGGFFTGSGTLVFSPGSIPYVTPEMWKAIGNGVADDTGKLQKAVDSAAGSATLVLPKGKSYRITSRISLPSDIAIDGEGTILVDYNQAVYTGALHGEGALDKIIALTANVLTNDTVIHVTSHSLVAGDMVAIGSDKSKGAYPVVIKMVKAATPSTIVFDSSVGVAYNTTERAYVRKIVPVTNISIKNIAFDQGAHASATYNYIYLAQGKNIEVSGVKFRKQSGNTASAVATANSYNVKVLNNTGDATFSPAGIFINIGTSSEVLTQGNASRGYAFGIGYYQLFRGQIVENNLIGPDYAASLAVSSAVRAIKLYGCVGTIVSANQVHHFETGLKIEGSSDCILQANRFSDMGLNASSHTINLGAAADHTASLNNSVAGNSIFGTTSNGIYADSTSSGLIQGNYITNAGASGMYIQGNSFLIANNYILGYVVSGITFSQLSVINGNFIHDNDSLRPSLATTGAFSPQNAATIVGNIATSNPVAATGSNPANFAVCITAGNNVRGIVGREFKALQMPTSGSWLAGDRVSNINPANGAIKAWRRVTSGGGNALNVDWVSE